jgi:carbonic anhydrase/acetyltransferase-like protein (isoleucine patch superfamily)
VEIQLGEARPNVDDQAWVASTAVLAGAVTVEQGASVWFGCVIRADGDRVTVGEESNVQDGVVIHADPKFPVMIGSRVSVGHGAILHGCSVGESALIGMRAVVLNGATIGPMCLVAAGALVLEGAEFEPRSLIAGIPAKRRRGLSDEECEALKQNAADYVALADRYRDADAR